MSVEYSPHGVRTPPSTLFRNPERRTVASYEQELLRHRRTESGLREALAREETESDHRLLNGVQIIVSLLSLQGRASENAEVASQLAGAADRIATIGRIHRPDSLDRVQTFTLKQYIEDLCRHFSMMMLSSTRPERVIVVEGTEIELPAVTAIPLGFIANELITNATKYGTGRITVRLEPN